MRKVRGLLPPLALMQVARWGSAMSPRRESALSAILAAAVGLFGALALVHFAVCEQDDTVCAFTGSPR